MTSELVFFVLFKIAGGFQKMFARLFWIKQVKVSKKAEQELFTCMYETRKNQHKKVLGDLSLVEEIFTTVASGDTRSLENVCTIILVL